MSNDSELLSDPDHSFIMLTIVREDHAEFVLSTCDSLPRQLLLMETDGNNIEIKGGFTTCQQVLLVERSELNHMDFSLLTSMISDLGVDRRLADCGEPTPLGFPSKCLLKNSIHI